MASLIKRKNANGETIWIIRYRIGGKQRQKTLGKTDRRTAQRLLVEFENRLARNDFDLLERKPITLQEYISDYLKIVASHKSEQTAVREEIILRHFGNFLPGCLLKDIDKKSLERFRVHRLKTHAPETVNLEYRHLKSIFNRALEHGYINRNPFIGLKPLRTPESNHPKFFELEDIAKVREAFAGDPFEHLVEFYLLTGTRLQEPLQLTWEMVDNRRKIITVPSKGTKAKKHRIISFAGDENLIALLAKLPRRHDDLLFAPQDDSQPQWKAMWVGKKISRRLTKAGFPWATCHTFRHTYISHLVMQGVPLTSVKEIVGHSDIKTTLRYAHLAPSHTKEMVSRRPY